MVVEATRDRRTERREATRGELLEAAWDLARAEGLAGLSLREVARKIGIRPPSLYWYFESKHAIYDAMFAQGYRQLLARLAEQEWPTEPRALLRLVARVFVEFSVEDVQRYQLMNQRTIPNFEPSAETYAVALQVFEEMRARLAAAGLSDPAALDMWIALVSGIAAQQTANEPGGDRWVRLIDEMVDIYADHLMGRQASPKTGGAVLNEVAHNPRH